MFAGEGQFDDNPRNVAVADRHLVEYEDGAFVRIVASEGEPVRFLLVSGKPIGEPIAWQGPIVMNTQEELDTAFSELENDTFVKTTKAGTT